MTGREKVVHGLERCLHYNGSCLECPYDGPNCQNDLLSDAIAILKEQEEDEPKQVGIYGRDAWYGIAYVCPYCNAAWMGDKTEAHFCPECGKAVKSGG